MLARTHRQTLLLATALAAAGVLCDTARAGDDKRAIDVIENDLVADDAAVRAKAAAELTDRFPDGAVAVPMLVDLLDDESPEVVAAAARAIDAMAVAGAVPLIQYIDQESKNPARTASTLNWLLPPIASLTDASPHILDVAEADRNCAHSPAVPVIGALVPWRSRRATMFTLAPTARSRSNARFTLAAAAIAMIGSDELDPIKVDLRTNPARTSAATSTLALLKSDQDLRAWMGIRVVARLRSSDAAVVEELTHAVCSEKQALDMGTFGSLRLARVAAADALASLGAAADPSMPNLLSLVRARGTEPLLRSACIRALIAIGPKSDLTPLLGEPDWPSDAIAVELALAGRTDERIVAQLAHALAAGDSMPPDLLHAIAMLGPAGKPLLPPLLERLRALAPLFAVGYADAILAIAPDDSEALKAIDAAIAGNALGSGRAWETLAIRARLSTALAARLASLLRGTKLEDMPEGWTSAIDGLGRCGPLARGAVIDLLRLVGLADRACLDAAMRAEACLHRVQIVTALGRIGRDAAAAVPALTALRDKGDETIRVPAAQALRRIRAAK